MALRLSLAISWCKAEALPRVGDQRLARAVNQQLSSPAAGPGSYGQGICSSYLLFTALTQWPRHVTHVSRPELPNYHPDLCSK